MWVTNAENTNHRNPRGMIVKAKLIQAALLCFLGHSAFADAADTPMAPKFISSGPSELADSPVQKASISALESEMERFHASAGAVVVLSANSGQILGLVSTTLDDPAYPLIRYDRAINRAQEPGTIMTVFPIAQAIDLGLVADTSSLVNTPRSFSVGDYSLKDDTVTAEQMSVEEIFLNGTHVGVAELTKMIGSDRQRAFLADLGFLETYDIEDEYPSEFVPMLQIKSGEAASFTTALGFGLTTSPLQLATAYASLVNGGMKVTPTFKANETPQDRIVSPETSAKVRDLLKNNVTDGPARLAEIPDYSIGGKAGTADMRIRGGGYSEEHVVNNFVGVFPADAPEYVVAVLLEDASVVADGATKNTAGWTVVPATAEIVQHVSKTLMLR